MGATAIYIDDDLKARVAIAAGYAGKTIHGFMLDAVVCAVEDSEGSDKFFQSADRRWEQALTTGRAITSEDMHAYLLARARGKHAKRPRARKIRP
jgi:predicted transcriptional regulator